MSHQDPFTLESELSRLEPPGLNAGLLDRLEACAYGNWLELTSEEIHFEAELRALFKPAAVPIRLHTRLEALSGTLSPATPENIAPMPVHVVGTKNRRRPWWSSAAAVAILGATAAWMLPQKSGLQPTQGPASVASAPTIQSPSAFVPASVNRVLSETHDEGIIWKQNQTPHRVLKVVYDEHVTLKDPSGKTYQVKQPRVEYFVVPTQPH